MRSHRPPLALLLLLTVTVEARAEEPLVVDAGPEWALTISGQIRPRFLTHSGLDFRGGASEWRELVTQRARLGVAAEAASGVGVTLEVQDVRIWGEELEPDEFAAKGLDLHQAYGTLPFTDELELDIGRLELSLDDERLLGRSDWSQRGRAFDGGRLAWTSLTGRHSVEALYAKVKEPGQSPEGHVPTGVDGDLDFGGVHASLELAPGHFLAPLYLVRIEQAPAFVRHTAGLYVKGQRAGFSYRAEGYYQYGKQGSGTIGAYFAGLTAGYELDLKLRPGVTAWGEILSGSGDPAGAFDTLYGTNHQYYGEMDLFDGPAATDNLGLIDVGGRLESGITSRLRARIDGHWLHLVTSPQGGSGNLGVELEAKLLWKVMDYVTLDALLGVFVPREGNHGLRTVPVDGDLHPDLLLFVTTNVEF